MNLQCKWYPSKNYHEGRLNPKTGEQCKAEYIIIHGTWVKDDNQSLKILKGETEHEVSVHYFIDHTGLLYQLVPDANVAWHAGVSAWKDRVGMNWHSIGIELGVANPNDAGFVKYTDEQYETLEQLLFHLLRQHHIPKENVLAHSDVSPLRKDDPGPAFNWQKLVSKNIAADVSFLETATYEEKLAYGYCGSEEAVKFAVDLRLGRTPEKAPLPPIAV